MRLCLPRELKDAIYALWYRGLKARMNRERLRSVKARDKVNERSRKRTIIYCKALYEYEHYQLNPQVRSAATELMAEVHAASTLVATSLTK